jgi:DNA modification methylase
MSPYYDQDGITIYHGDCREVLPTLASADAFVMDPPYGTKVDRDGYGRRQLYAGTRQIAGDEDLSLMSIAMRHARRMVRQGGWVAAFCSPKRHDEAATACRTEGFEVAGEVVWDKLRPGLGGGIRYQHETVLLCHAGGASGNAAMFSVLRGMIASDGRQDGHPHEKPLNVMGSLVCYCSKPGELVVDPFSGSGTTLVAAKLNGRLAIGIEVEERWCEIAAKRLAQGVLFGTGGAA